MSSNLPSPSNVTYSKSSRRCFNSSFLNPNLVNRAQNHRYENPTSSFSHGFSSASHGNPINHILKSRSKFDNIFRHPSRFSSRLSSHNLVESSPDGEIKVARTNKNLKLAVLFGFWYLLNLGLTAYNNNSWNAFLTCIQLPLQLPYDCIWIFILLYCDESIWKFILRSLKLQPCPKIDNSFIVALPGPALFLTIGHISILFSKVAVFFTQVVKSVQSVFSVVFSSFLGSYMLLLILIIVSCCTLAAIRKLYSKTSFQCYGLNLYGWISIISLFSVFPVDAFIEGFPLVPGYLKAIAGVALEKSSSFYLWVLLSRLFLYLFKQSSSESMERVLVIAATLLVFGNPVPVRPLNAFGAAIAISGTFLYLQVMAARAKGKN